MSSGISKFAKRIETMNSEVDKLMVLINSLVNGNVISFGGGAPALEAYPMEQLNEIAQAVFQRTPAGYGAFKYGSAMGNEDLRKAVNDIKSKINEGYEVYSREKINDIQEGPRKCRYSDFAIIVRTKRESRTFMEIFSKYNIPLNLILDTDLLEIDAIIVIQSLFSLIGNAIFGISVDKRHLFASVARSYLYQYTDQQVHECLLLSDSQRKLINELKSILVSLSL